MPSSRNKRKQSRRSRMDRRLPMLILLSGLLLLLIIVMPKSPVVRAVNASGEAVSSTHAGLRISEVMTDNASALPDERGAFGDWVEIWNSTEQTMSLKDIGLSDRAERIKFIFPDVSIIPGGRVIVFCDGVNANAPGEVFHAKFSLSSTGESVYLFDSTGVAIDMVKIPTLNVDESYLLNESGAFEVSDEYSPEYENTFAGHAAYLAAYTVEPNTIYLNEIMPAPRSGIRDEDDELSDWIELYNAGDRDVSLATLAISDDPTKPVKWVFPKDAVIPAHGYYFVFCSGKDKMEEFTRYPHANFSINAEKEIIVLSTVAGELVDRVVIENIGRDVSYGRDPDTMEWKVFTLATPYAPNDASGAAKADSYLRAVNPTGVYLSEVMSSADKVLAAAGESASDYVEIYNSTAQTVNISGWGLSDNVNWPRKWVFPQGAAIQPGEYKIILLDKSASSGLDGSKFHASFALARAGGEMMTLSDATGRVLDRMYLPEIPTDVSYGRTLGTNGFFYYETPTPRAANGAGFTGYTAAPAFVTQSGLYKDVIYVEISVPEGTTVRYTTDGSVPTLENSAVYAEPIRVALTTVIRARAFSSGVQPSAAVTATYLMNTYHTLRIVSLVCEPDELWNETDGLLTAGENVNKEKIPFKNTIYREFGKIDRPGYVEVFEKTSGDKVISQGIKMDLMGDYSLDMPQKSFKVRAQASGGAKYFDYPLFEERDFTSYKSFTLRNSGNDCVWTRVNDWFQTNLIDKYVDTDIIRLAGEPVVVYLNGVYWGHYNMRERKDRFCIAQWEGLDEELADQITILRAGWSTVQGSNAEYRAMLKKIETLSPGTKPEDLQYMLDRIDVESYMDWFAIKMFFGDSDPGNIMFYKLPTEGAKWKCLVFDLDYGMFQSKFNSPWSYLKEAGMGQQKINNLIFRKFLENADILDLFLTKLGAIYQTLTSEVMKAEFDACIAEIEPEMNMHFNRWAEFNEKTINSDSPMTADGMMRYWKTRINFTSNVIRKRPYYIYTLTQEQFKLTNEQMLDYFGGPCPAQPED